MSTASDRVLVAGASGDTGRELLTVLGPSELTVRATTRSRTRTDALERLGADEVVVVDFFEPADAVRAVKGCDVVLCALGTPPGPRHVLGGKLVDRTGVTNLVTAAVGADVDHVVYESAIGVGSSRERLPRPGRLLIRATLRAKEDAETAIRRSGLGYTIVRPGKLTNEPPRGDVLVGEGGDTLYGTIPRADVARVMAAAPFTPEARNRTFEIASRGGLRDTPRNLVNVAWDDDRFGIEPRRDRPHP
ncbi:NAD(P)-binding oxidoreductase [Natrialbaceae archaeon AArc-T1-2]|uniref:NAD(P)-binding oxidoreductase n=1 Tax=Natrialbaceae archaeon AArc-T1-2 TaxID=3053904 RepID=UPI00255AEBA1|nr:NAD(P)-binding oxidoreductase [Natrialbaceae archaeon AArc-T1-2]WIV66158.1 SDR family oxidoreductase [Natrialbaceae archaeon AArc-T1-2]